MAMLACATTAWCGGLSSDAVLERARRATFGFNQAQDRKDPNADSMLQEAIGLWETYLVTHPASLEGHEKASYLLSRVIGRAWEGGTPTDSGRLRPIQRKVAFHRQRMLELSGGRACSPMEVAYSYQQAGDFQQAERFYLRVGEPLVLFRFYVEEKQAAKAEQVFSRMSSFKERLQAAKAAVGELAIHCGLFGGLKWVWMALSHPVVRWWAFRPPLASSPGLTPGLHPAIIKLARSGGSRLGF